MSVKELQNYTFFSKYARYRKDLKRRETWAEAVDRMKQMHLRRYPALKDEIEWAFGYVEQQKVLGSQRALQYGGKPIERKNGRLYNCVASFCDRLRFFQESFWLLLCGSGVGFSVQKHHVSKLPEFTPKRFIRDEKGQIQYDEPLSTKKFVVPDTIEGWADALGVLLSSYFASPIFPEYEGHNVEFDFSIVRPKGSDLSSGAGKAPGPEPLRAALQHIKGLLDRCVLAGQVKLRPIDAYDVVMHSSDAVLSGGVRRSATICIFSLDDDEMIKAKTGNWYHDNPQRARSNNSALLLRDQISREDFLKIINSVRQFGEPGFVFSDSTEIVYNPCAEIGLYPIDETTGETGWQACNLSEINGKLVKNRQDFYMAAIAASIIGTLQAGYTDFEYLGPVSERIIRREALLGVSITGMMDSVEVLFDPENQRTAAEIVKFTNREIAEKIGINPAARTTCVKPSGTASSLLGCASGIHMHHAKRYLRRVQANRMEVPYQAFASVNPHACEDSVWSANKTDSVIAFCCEVDGKIKNDMTAIQFLDHVKLTQNNWVKFGKDENRCVKPWLDHNVSNTCTVLDDEWMDVGNYLYDNRGSFAAVSLLSVSGDKDYPQAPFTAIYTLEEIEKMYGDIPSEAYDDYWELYARAAEAFDGNIWAAWDLAIRNHNKIVLIDCTTPKDICRAYMEANARNYFDGDIRKASYFFKDLYNLNMWNELKDKYKSVDYTQIVEEEDNTKIMETVACAGGACQLEF